MIKCLIPLLLLNNVIPSNAVEVGDVNVTEKGIFKSLYGEKGIVTNLLESGYSLIADQDLNITLTFGDNLRNEDVTFAYKSDYGEDLTQFIIDGSSFNGKKTSDGWIYLSGNFASKVLDLPFCLDEFIKPDGVESKFYWMLYTGSVIPRDEFFVKDNIAPVIIGSENLSLKCSNNSKLKIEEITKYFSATDNFDFNPSIEVLNYNDYLQFNGNGKFELEVCSKDNANNKSKIIKVVVNQVDDTGPEIIGPDKIFKGSQKLFSTEETLNLYQAVDASECSIEFLDGDSNGNNKYLNNASNVGNYIFRIMAKDVYENIGTKTVNISIRDNIAPVVYYDNYVLVESNIQLEMKDFINLLKESGEVDTRLTNEFQVVKDDYTTNKSVSGTFDYHLKIRSSNGESKTKEFRVKVTKVNFEYREEYEKTWIDHIGDFFKSIGDWFWVNIFRPIARLFGYQG